MDKVKLPQFDGTLTKWLEFKDQFVDLIHTNARFPPANKFITLRNNLKGLALDAIAGFKLSAANYENAWNVILRRYDKPDRIIDEYIRQLDKLPVLTHPTAKELI